MMGGPKTQRWGIGPVFGTITACYALAAWGVTCQRPGVFRIDVIPAKWLVTAGVLVMSWGAWRYVAALRVLNRALDTGSLAVEGPFAKVRHPIYAAWILLMLPGLGLVLRSWLVLSAVGVGYLSFRGLIVREEAHVAATHGRRYAAYSRSRGRLLPRLGRPPEPATGDLSADRTPSTERYQSHCSHGRGAQTGKR